MLILAIDTALDHCAAAVLDTDSAAMRAEETLPMKRGHAEALMPLIARVMRQSGVGFHELDRIAVTTGPGSFTGLRVGLSAARGIALAAHKPVVGVTTLSAYAAPIVSEDRANPVISAIDARHDHVYYQVVSGCGEELVAPQVAATDDVLAAARLGAPHLVGNAAALLAERWPKEAAAPVAVDSQDGPDIGWVAWLGAAADPAHAPARPFYLRAPDVKPPAGAARQPAQTAVSS
ncbi:tRNA (adenosine(37)-N6)-threonylcarbamoyltransferase complex dimerization subunit type 1 TsaB [Bradyrhizobium sp. HKCCYLRH1073]|uniref:tRNA (adenosine(37)-N6)-threonylcarbamoyltransferase complex dimerization subunit type 1 TsaB n=1 Tax=unclassified Bradyrhizobium TaxID=2631580 RepID=UPI0029171032|nr:MULTISPECIES: tRNA (adenosine(37)-N6)-threonylcarbamoyltransferase complex dimerization subunit type 1 TsaB [unclassified Bradyrhizobium]